MKAIRALAMICISVLSALCLVSAQTSTPTHLASTSERVCPAATPGHFQCTARRLVVRPPNMAKASGAITPNITPSGFGPADLLSAYNLTSISASTGAGRTIAIVDAFDDPTAESDLAVYRSTFGLSACTTANGCFKKVNQNGAASPLPSVDLGWDDEISLDLDMASAICPNCKILLVEATDATTTDLGTAVNTAATLGAIAISNSYGGDESSSDVTTCSTYFSHPGIAITVSSGDDGYGVEDPANCPGVTAVGGTSLSTSNSDPRGWTESVWGSANNENGGAGSGCSTVITKPSWQTDSGCTKRTVADVSAIADPETGVAVYDQGLWLVFGGTSVSSPIIAGVYALATPPNAGDIPVTYAYADPGDLNDVTSGTNGQCGGSYLCNAEVGYDGPTGLGTPNGVVAFGPTVSNDFSIFANPTGFSLAPGGSNTASISTTLISGSAQTIALTISGVPSGATAGFSPTSVTAGGSSTLTINAGTAAPNTYPLTITGTGTSATHTTPFSLTVTGVPSFSLSASPNALSIAKGGASGTSTIAVTPMNGFSSNVTFAASGLPNGVTASFSPNPSGSSSVLTLTASSLAKKGTTTVTITGTSGSLIATTNVALTVNTLGNFSIKALPGEVRIAQGSNGIATVDIFPTGGFNQQVFLSVAGLPSGVTSLFSPNPATPFSTLQLTVSPTATLGKAAITVTGTYGSLTHKSTFHLTVTH